MDEVEKVEHPSMLQSFMVALLLFGIILAPATGMVFYFYTPIQTRIGGYVGASLLAGSGVGILISIVIAGIFAKKASG